ncbi:MAG: hypothetical protein L0154_27085 [Chloroflexi bacterium]|nr:hypothetical protein [Chloroflexota bacterium]
MAPKQSKPLTHADTTSANEVARKRDAITDEVAHKMGYPSAELYRMERKLADLADEWRRTHSQSVLTEYHALYYKMIVFGYSPSAFAPDTEIETEFMPELPELQQTESKD